MASRAPQTLIDLRVMLADLYQVERSKFGIRGTISPRRPWGYHLGKNEIYGPDGMGDKDYSVRRRRDKRGLTDASAGFDINIGGFQERKIVAHLLGLARSGQDGGMLVEIIGPDSAGVAHRWVKPRWVGMAARQDHDWHIHLSFLRDTELLDKRPLFYGLFGISEYPPTYDGPTDPMDHPEEPTDPTPPDEVPDDAQRVEELEATLAAIGEIANAAVEGEPGDVEIGPLEE